ncbi:MAG: toll/interleukin-1 receptor domain-containing protein [Bryobacteraceae bacterium]|nr:toll/interleukin-1 receptor domain-containing protein [Bryobacteraceae bacterium]
MPDQNDKSVAIRRQFGEVIKQCLVEGLDVELEGLGVFHPINEGGLDADKVGMEFVPANRFKVFIAYVDEEFDSALHLYNRFRQEGLDPWINKRKLMPGQDWVRCVDHAISVTDIFLPCYSRRAAQKRGQFQREVRFAMEGASQMPFDDVFIMPVRLDDCVLPIRITNQIQFVDMFPDWEAGFQEVLASIRHEERARELRRLQLAC